VKSDKMPPVNLAEKLVQRSGAKNNRLLSPLFADAFNKELIKLHGGIAKLVDPLKCSLAGNDEFPHA